MNSALFKSVKEDELSTEEVSSFTDSFDSGKFIGGKIKIKPPQKQSKQKQQMLMFGPGNSIKSKIDWNLKY